MPSKTLWSVTSKQHSDLYHLWYSTVINFKSLPSTVVLILTRVIINVELIKFYQYRDLYQWLSALIFLEILRVQHPSCSCEFYVGKRIYLEYLQRRLLVSGLEVWNGNFHIDGACHQFRDGTTASPEPSSPSSSWERFSVDNNKRSYSVPYFPLLLIVPLFCYLLFKKIRLMFKTL